MRFVVGGMDPLGVTSTTEDIFDLPTWNVTDVPEYETSDGKDDLMTIPFRCQPELNDKLVLWNGDLTALRSHAIVNSTNENLSDRNHLSMKILEIGGDELKSELKTGIKSCRTGEARLSKAYNLPCRFIIHTVGPRYNKRYITAAECALFNCYRNVLNIMREASLTTVGICPIHSEKRGYPAEEGTHIALRTIRRFLEKRGDFIERVLLTVQEPNGIFYRTLAPLYFPRNRSEELFSARNLPYNIGNEEGEPILPERIIRISANPFRKSDASDNGELDNDDDLDVDADDEAEEAEDVIGGLDVAEGSVGNHAFAKMEENPDVLRKHIIMNKERARLMSNLRRYDRWLRRARQADLSSIASLRCIYRSGTDIFGRPIIVVIGRNIPANHLDYQKAAMYFINLMEPVVREPYIVVYLHTDTTRDNQPSISFLKEIYNLVDERYRKHLHAFYIVHPTFWARMLTWFFTTFTASDIKSRVTRVNGLQELYDCISPDQLDLPDFVYECDREEEIRRILPKTPGQIILPDPPPKPRRKGEKRGGDMKILLLAKDTNFSNEVLDSVKESDQQVNFATSCIAREFLNSDTYMNSDDVNDLSKLLEDVVEENPDTMDDFLDSFFLEKNQKMYECAWDSIMELYVAILKTSLGEQIIVYNCLQALYTLCLLDDTVQMMHHLDLTPILLGVISAHLKNHSILEKAALILARLTKFPQHYGLKSVLKENGIDILILALETYGHSTAIVVPILRALSNTLSTIRNNTILAQKHHDGDLRPLASLQNSLVKQSSVLEYMNEKGLSHAELLLKRFPNDLGVQVEGHRFLCLINHSGQQVDRMRRMSNELQMLQPRSILRRESSPLATKRVSFYSIPLESEQSSDESEESVFIS